MVHKIENNIRHLSYIPSALQLSTSQRSKIIKKLEIQVELCNTCLFSTNRIKCFKPSSLRVDIMCLNILKRFKDVEKLARYFYKYHRRHGHLSNVSAVFPQLRWTKSNYKYLFAMKNGSFKGKVNIQ